MEELNKNEDVRNTVEIFKGEKVCKYQERERGCGAKFHSLSQ